MIESLTEYQKSQIPVWVEKWTAIGLSTDQDSNFKDCFEIVKAIYKDEAEIKDFIVVDSPMGVYNICKDSSFLSKSFFGSFECGWLSYYSYFQDVVGIKVNDALNYFITLASNTSLVYMHNDTVIFSRKPTEIHLENNQLHNESGPAVLFADGFEVYSIRGNRVTEQIVMRPETLTVEQINEELNSDVQSIMLDRFGWERYIDESGSKIVDSRRNDIENTLEVLYETNKFGLRLVCTCPTGRVFVKGIPNTKQCRTCESAQNWLAGDRKQFRTIART